MRRLKLRNQEGLNELRKTIVGKRPSDKQCIIISSGTCGRARGSSEVVQAFRKEIRSQKLRDLTSLRVTGCHGFCQAEPIVVIHPEGIFYQNVRPKDAKDIVRETILRKNVIDRLLYTDPETGKRIVYEDEIPFYWRQNRLILALNALVEPTSIEDYLAIGGYSALQKVLTTLTPEQVIDEVKRSSLRGRGGAGFYTGVKWGLCRQAKGDMKYVICNADEGDPGAYMDRSLLEGNPHSILEGMIIGGYAIGASEGIIYVRTEYPLAVENAGIAIGQARQLGLLGKDILGSGFDFDISIARGAGAFVCGEETALIASIEGRIGEPLQRPPFPAEKGLYGKPTNINNVETWANIRLIVEKGADWFNRVGTARSKGTKIFSLVGKVRNTGLVEVPMGMTLREVIYDIGGGLSDGQGFKAVQTGGPSGGCIPGELLDLPIDYESLTQAGSIMGSGGMVVMDEDTCMVDTAKYFLGFLESESCGKCFPCRKGIQRMLEIVTDISEGKGREGDIELLEELAHTVKDASLCGLGQTAPNPVLSTIRHFRDEYEEHVKYKRCPAVVCKGIISSPCQYTCPLHQDVPCYIGLIAKGQFEDAIKIIRKENPLPSICGRVCTHPCEDKCESGKTGKPISIRALKRFAADYELGMEKDILPPYQITKDEKIAIIGSGPAGLTVAHYLSLMGYKVTIFEALPAAGGMLAVGIPDYRLPKENLQKEIDAIMKAGVDIKLNTRIGKDLTIDDIQKDGYKAIFIATGAHESTKLNVPGEDLKGVIHGVSLLRDINLGKEVKIGAKVAVIGGGNVAIDSACSTLRLGSKDVTILYRRSRVEMPASEEEISQAEEDGVKIRYLAAPTKILGSNGNVEGVECIRMELGPPDESGRRQPIPIKGSEFKMECDTVIPAIGQVADLSFISGDGEIRSTDKGTLAVDQETFETSREGIFAGGDVVTGPATIVEAIAAGKEVAKAINSYLQGKRYKKEYKVITPAIHVEPIELGEEEIEKLERPEMPRLPIAARIGNFREVELGLTQEMAIMEAKRCLRCDLERGE